MPSAIELAVARLPGTWTAIAWRPCDPMDGWWRDLPDAPLSRCTAMSLQESGEILMATRLEGVRYVLLVKRARFPRSKQGRPVGRGRVRA